MSRIKILIANRYFLMSYAIKCILQKIKNLEIHGVDEKEILTGLKKLKPELLVLEMEIIKQDSFRLLTELKKYFPQLKILALIDCDEKEKLMKILQYRLEGYLSKNTSQEELIEAVETIHKGERYFSKKIHQYILDNVFDEPGNSEITKSKNNLSERENEVLKEIITGKNNREIADRLFISENTVLTHRRNIMRKLKVTSTPQLIFTSFKNGLISFND